MRADLQLLYIELQEIDAAIAHADRCIEAHAFSRRLKEAERDRVRRSIARLLETADL